MCKLKASCHFFFMYYYQYCSLGKIKPFILKLKIISVIYGPMARKLSGLT